MHALQDCISLNSMEDCLTIAGKNWTRIKPVQVWRSRISGPMRSGCRSPTSRRVEGVEKALSKGLGEGRSKGIDHADFLILGDRPER